MNALAPGRQYFYTWADIKDDTTLLTMWAQGFLELAPGGSEPNWKDLQNKPEIMALIETREQADYDALFPVPFNNIYTSDINPEWIESSVFGTEVQEYEIVPVPRPKKSKAPLIVGSGILTYLLFF